MVSTPIGNLKDITLRAVEVLKSVDLVACEDTRRTVKLLTALDIRKPLKSVRAQNEERAAREIIRELSDGKDVAYTSDAGTPSVSDPGARLVRAVRMQGSVLSLFSASALTALLSVCGFPLRGVVLRVFWPERNGSQDLQSSFRVMKVLLFMNRLTGF